MKILIVENEEAIADILAESIESRFQSECSGLAIEHHGFEDALVAIDDFSPDAVILDIYGDSIMIGGHTFGMKIADKILDSGQSFLIIFSGFPESIPNIDELERNSSVEIVRKGAGSETKIADILYDIYFDV